MHIEFDSAKDAINRNKHGVSLAFGELVLLARNRIIIDAIRPEDREERRKAIGLIDGTVMDRRVRRARGHHPVHLCEEKQRCRNQGL